MRAAGLLPKIFAIFVPIGLLIVGWGWPTLLVDVAILVGFLEWRSLKARRARKMDWSHAEAFLGTALVVYKGETAYRIFWAVIDVFFFICLILLVMITKRDLSPGLLWIFVRCVVMGVLLWLYLRARMSALYGEKWKERGAESFEDTE